MTVKPDENVPLSVVPVLRLPEHGRLALTQRPLCEVIASEDVEQWLGCLVVVTARKIRARRTPLKVPD